MKAAKTIAQQKELAKSPAKLKLNARDVVLQAR